MKTRENPSTTLFRHAASIVGLLVLLAIVVSFAATANIWLSLILIIAAMVISTVIAIYALLVIDELLKRHSELKAEKPRSNETFR